MRGLPFFKPKKGIQFAGEGFTDTSGGGGGGSSGLVISNVETKVGTYNGNDLYSIAISGYGSALSWVTITGFTHNVIYGNVIVTAQSGDIYTQPCEFCKSTNTVEYKTVTSTNAGSTGTIILFYTK